MKVNISTEQFCKMLFEQTQDHIVPSLEQWSMIRNKLKIVNQNLVIDERRRKKHEDKQHDAD